MKINNLIIFSLLLIIFTACGYDMIDSKEGKPIDPVSNLHYSVSGSDVILTWDLPPSYPSDIIQPVSIFIKVTKASKDKLSNDYPLYSPNALNAGTFTIVGNIKNFTYNQYDPNYTYRFTIKIMGGVDVDSPNYSDLRYSKGVTVEI